MDKKQAINIITESCMKYQKNLENKNFLFIYNSNEKTLKSLETLFLKSNFLHLTGIKLKNHRIKSSTQFYNICSDNKLSPNDFEFSSNGTTELKLNVLPQIINIPYNAKMIGDYLNTKKLLVTEKVIGNIFLSLGFIQDRNEYYIPNTALNENIKRITVSQNKIIAILEKNAKDKHYRTISCVDKNKKGIDISEMLNELQI